MGQDHCPNRQPGKHAGYLNPIRYRGYVYDEETGLYYLRSRYYNPEWGRFINADILLGKSGVLLGHNLIAYCGNNAVRNTDHTGMIYVAAELYTIALSVEDFSDHNFSNSLLSEKFTKRVRDSEVVRDQVKAYINAIPSGETMYSQTEAINWGVVDSIKTLSMSDLDLALAVGNCANFTITVEQVDKNGYESLFILGEKYKVTYKVRDLYDFDLREGTERHPAVIWLNDTFGYYPQEANVLHEYWYTVTGEYYVFAIK